MFIAALFTAYAHNIVCAYTHRGTKEYYSVMRKKQILPFVPTRMNMEHIMLSEISQAETGKNCMAPLIYGILKKFFLNLETKRIETCLTASGGGGNREELMKGRPNKQIGMTESWWFPSLPCCPPSGIGAEKVTSLSHGGTCRASLRRDPPSERSLVDSEWNNGCPHGSLFSQTDQCKDRDNGQIFSGMPESRELSCCEPFQIRVLNKTIEWQHPAKIEVYKSSALVIRRTVHLKSV